MHTALLIIRNMGVDAFSYLGRQADEWWIPKLIRFAQNLSDGLASNVSLHSRRR
jgi:hypothetical protein